MKLKPLGARALVKMVESEEQTASGIVLPDTAREKPQTAEVVTVGDSDEVNVSVGDVVVLAKYSGTEVKIEGEEHLIVSVYSPSRRGCRWHPKSVLHGKGARQDRAPARYKRGSGERTESLVA